MDKYYYAHERLKPIKAEYLLANKMSKFRCKLQLPIMVNYTRFYKIDNHNQHVNKLIHNINSKQLFTSLKN